MREKIAGIIGGMGPEATVDLMARVIRATPALDDADHIRMLVDNNPKIPSRIKALIEGTGVSPAPCLAEMARKLEAWGADFLAIPCNTAHYYLADFGLHGAIRDQRGARSRSAGLGCLSGAGGGNREAGQGYRSGQRLRAAGAAKHPWVR